MGYFRKPNRKELGYALSMQGKPLEMTEMLLKQCFVGGSRVFVDDTEYMLGSARTAHQWQQFNQDDNMFLFPNIRWLPSRSVTPREQHMPFYNRVWAKNDPFWQANQPGNLWNCKCDWEETDDPVTSGNPEGIRPAKGLEGNPAETGEIFTDQCTYVQRAGKNTEHDALKVMWKDNFRWALEHVRGKTVRNPGIEEEINISRRGIKEFLNQNHDDYLVKNEMIRHITDILGKAEYMGKTMYGGKVSKIFKIKLKGKDNYIIFFSQRQ